MKFESLNASFHICHSPVRFEHVILENKLFFFFKLEQKIDNLYLQQSTFVSARQWYDILKVCKYSEEIVVEAREI